MKNNRKLNRMQATLSADERAAEQLALRELLDSFRDEQEMLLESTLDDNRVRQKIGRVIGDSLARSAWPGDRG